MLESVCFGGFAAALLYLTGSGKYLQYVTPKMAPYLCFTAIVMLVWAASRFRQAFRPQYKTRAVHCLVLVIPLFLLLLPLGTISSAALSSGYSAVLNGGSGGTAVLSGEADSGAPSGKGSGTSGTGSGSASQSSPVEENSASSGGAAESSAGENSGSSSGMVAAQQSGLTLSEDGTIEVSDEQFYPWLSEIYANMDRYDGKVITIKGFVYRDAQSMRADEFVPARMLMYCCAADLIPCGILCRYNQVSELKEGAWITVTGTIHVEEDAKGQKQPVVAVTKIVPASQPDEEYVYPW